MYVRKKERLEGVNFKDNNIRENRGDKREI